MEKKKTQGPFFWLIPRRQRALEVLQGMAAVVQQIGACDMDAGDYVKAGKNAVRALPEVQPEKGDLGRQASSCKSGCAMVADGPSGGFRRIFGSRRTIFIKSWDTGAMPLKNLILESYARFVDEPIMPRKKSLSGAMVLSLFSE